MIEINTVDGQIVLTWNGETSIGPDRIVIGNKALHEKYINTECQFLDTETFVSMDKSISEATFEETLFILRDNTVLTQYITGYKSTRGPTFTPTPEGVVN